MALPNLTPQQWDAVDAAITAENISSIEYIRIAYKQGIIDAFSILRVSSMKKEMQCSSL